MFESLLPHDPFYTQAHYELAKESIQSHFYFSLALIPYHHTRVFPMTLFFILFLFLYLYSFSLESFSCVT